MSERISPPAPTKALELLKNTAYGDTSGSNAARSFLFWLVGEEDPTGFKGQGALELRVLDGNHLKAAFEVLVWWSGSVWSRDPVYEILEQLRKRFA